MNNEDQIELDLPDDLLKQIFAFTAKEAWAPVLSSCKKFYNLGLPIFIEKVYQTATTIIMEEPTPEEKRVNKLIKLNNLYKVVKQGVQDTFVVSQSKIESVPWMEADGVMVTFPLIESSIAPLIAKAETTPFGKGMETLVDSNIRSGWQILGSKIQIHSEKWHELLSNDGILKAISRDLTPNSQSIRVELDKLLIYGPGDKFKAHKDTIRGKNHFGSLVIFLPSVYEGGELVVRHHNFEQSYQFSLSKQTDELLRCHCVSFFTDCEHEVLPVKSGYRVTLTYHLYYEYDSITTDLLISNDYSSQIYEGLFRAYLEKQKINKSQISQLGIILSHDYSQATLSPEQLKGRDQRLYKIFSSSSLLNIDLVPIKIEIQGKRTGYDCDTEKISSKSDWKDVQITGNEWYSSIYYKTYFDGWEDGPCRFIQPLKEIKIYNSYELSEYETEYYRYTCAALLISLKRRKQ